MPLFLSDSEVRELFTVDDALSSARRAFAAIESSTMPQRVALAVPDHDGTHLTMPCYLRDADGEILSIKVATVFDGNRGHGHPTTMAHLILHDASTGRVLAIMEAEYLTAMRTAAASALATQYLARPEPRSLGIFGAGGQAEAHARVFQDAFPTIELVFVQARSVESAQSFCERMASSRTKFQVGVPVAACDILCLATNSAEPLFDSNDL